MGYEELRREPVNDKIDRMRISTVLNLNKHIQEQGLLTGDLRTKTCGMRTVFLRKVYLHKICGGPSV